MNLFLDTSAFVKLYHNVVEIDNSIKSFAVELLDELASTKNFRTLDALQLSSAIISNQNFPLDYFIASDERFLDIAKDFKFLILLCNDTDPYLHRN